MLVIIEYSFVLRFVISDIMQFSKVPENEFDNLTFSLKVIKTFSKSSGTFVSNSNSNSGGTE